MGAGVLYGVNATIAAAGGASQILQGMVDGRAKVMVDSYVTLGTGEDATSTIAMGSVLPKGARILDVILALSGALSASVTLDVGDASDPNRYLDSVACSAQTVVHMTALTAGLNYIIGTDTSTDDTQVLVTISDQNNAVSAAVIKLIVIYALD